jgi:hypothetical protein
VAAGVGAVVAGQLDEVDLVRNRDGAREIGEEDEARLQQRDQQQVASRVVLGDRGPELADASVKLLGVEEDLADTGVRDLYEARSSRYRWASRSMSRL